VERGLWSSPSGVRLGELGRLKFNLLSQGARLTAGAEEFLFSARDGRRTGTSILRTRSGVSGGLDIALDVKLGVYVNVPVREALVESSPYRFEALNGMLRLAGPGDDRHDVIAMPEPDYYSRMASDGTTLLSRIAQMCSPDRLCFGMTGPGCSFWSRKKRCAYCSIGYNYNADASHKLERQFLEVVEQARADTIRPASHLLIGGGTPPGVDMGASMAARLTRAIKVRYDMPVYVMIAAPLADEYIDELFEAGVDELGMNLEFWSDEAWRDFIPGKQSVIGKGRYLQALEYAGRRFGPYRARSIIIAGLEPAEDTVRAVEQLCDIGVMPIISPFRPLVGTALVDRRGFTGAQYWDLYEECQNIAIMAGLVLGPTCIGCQNNVLSLPGGPPYRRY